MTTESVNAKVELEKSQIKGGSSNETKTVVRQPSEVYFMKKSTNKSAPLRDVHYNLLDFTQEIICLAISYKKFIEDKDWLKMIEADAKSYRELANIKDADLPVHSTKLNFSADSLYINPIFSPRFSKKLFVGGLVPSITEERLHLIFNFFGPHRIERSQKRERRLGHCYVVFKSDDWWSKIHPYLFIRGNKLWLPVDRVNNVEIIPWKMEDCEYPPKTGFRAKYNKGENHSVFVGALHGLMTAKFLYTTFTDLFGQVTYVALDTDKYNYPVGSGRVNFKTVDSYSYALHTNVVKIETGSFRKTIQIDPYLEDSMCFVCQNIPGTYFCRSSECNIYYCMMCWCKSHDRGTSHKPIRRTFNSMSNWLESSDLAELSRNAFLPAQPA